MKMSEGPHAGAQNASPTAEGDRLPVGLCVGYGVGSFAIAILLNTITTFFPALMVTVLGQSAAVAGSLLTLSKLYDIVADLVIGHASDRTRSRWGRRRPYLLAGAVTAAFSFLMIFIPPDLSDNMVVIYMGLALIIYSTGYSLFAIPYIAMAGEMTDDYNERTRLLSFRVFFISVGQILASAGIAAIIDWLGQGAKGYAVMGAAAASILFTGMLMCFFGTANAKRVDTISAVQLSRSEQWQSLFKNRPFVTLMSVKFIQYLAIAIMSTTKLLFMLNVLKLGYQGLINLAFVQYAVSGLCVPFWVWVSRHYGKREAYLLATFLLILVLLSWTWTDTTISSEMIWLRGALTGLASSGMILLSIAMLPDVMEYDRHLTGQRREGVFSGAYAIVEKMGFAVGPGLMGILLSVSGYIATTKGQIVDQPAVVISTLYAGMSWIPAALLAFSILLMFSYRLDKKTLMAMR